MLITEAIQDYLIYLQVIQNKSIKTIESYKNNLLTYQNYLFNQSIETMEEITVSHFWWNNSFWEEMDVECSKEWNSGVLCNVHQSFGVVWDLNVHCNQIFNV